MAVFTGDTLFIGDVGRPDLSGDMTPQQLAGLLFDSLHSKLLKLPDDVLVYPAHGAGSLCGRQMSNERSSTIGRQKISNYALRPKSREEFVQLLTAELPERPGYFALDVEINRAGAPPLENLAPIPALRPGELIERQKSGAIVLDTRPGTDFGAAHIPGSIQIGLNGQYASWAAILLGLQAEIVLVRIDPSCPHQLLTLARLLNAESPTFANYEDRLREIARDGETLLGRRRELQEERLKALDGIVFEEGDRKSVV